MVMLHQPCSPSKRIQLTNQASQLPSDNAPGDTVVDIRISVHEKVAQGHGTRQVGNPSGGRRIEMAQPAKGFAKDRELPFDGRPQQLVRQLVIERLSLCKACNARRSLPGVPEVLFRLSRHGRAAARGRCAP